jgi:hypothetical protein
VKIIYLANHNSGGNDDEGAILFALRTLGHDVEPIHERLAVTIARKKADLLLFHKWHDPGILSHLHGKMLRVFFYPDLVDSPDPSLFARCRQRKEWMLTVTPHVELGFMSDGEWVSKDRSGKLVWLTQGADVRVVQRATVEQDIPILFTGIYAGGAARTSFVDEMKEKYGPDFHHVQKGVHGKELANLIARAEIVVAPDGPIAGAYWSNRVFLSLGFGAFMLHPYCDRLPEFYEDGSEVVYYRNRSEFHDKIRWYLYRKGQREQIANAGYERTVAEHLYLHRVEKLLSVVKERIL